MKKPVGFVTLEESLNKFASESPENKQIVETSKFLIGAVDDVVARRKKLKLSQRALGDLALMKQPYIARVERLETNVSLANFFKIVNALGGEIKIKWKRRN